MEETQKAEARKMTANGASRREIAKTLGVSRSTVQNYVRGVKKEKSEFERAAEKADRAAELKLSSAKLQTMMFQSACQLLITMKPATRMKLRRHMEETYGQDS